MRTRRVNKFHSGGTDTVYFFQLIMKENWHIKAWYSLVTDIPLYWQSEKKKIWKSIKKYEKQIKIEI